MRATTNDEEGAARVERSAHFAGPRATASAALPNPTDKVRIHCTQRGCPFIASAPHTGRAFSALEAHMRVFHVGEVLR